MSPLGALTLLTLCLVIHPCVIIEDGQTKSVKGSGTLSALASCHYTLNTHTSAHTHRVTMSPSSRS